MRKFTLQLVGCLYIALGLYGMAPWAGQFISTSWSYNIFLIVMGLLALGAADLGGREGKWFDFAFGLMLILLTIIGSYNYLYFGQGSLGGVIVNGLAAIALLYIGLILNHRLKHQTK